MLRTEKLRKITVVSWYFPVREEPYRGHSAYQTLRRMKELVDVEVLCPQPSYPRFLGPRTYLHSRTDLTYSLPDLPVRYLPYPVVPVLSRVLNGFNCARVVEPYLRASAPDVILSYKAYPEGYAAVALGRRLGIPVVLNAIGSDLNSIAGPFSKALVRRALRGATMVAAVSEHLRRRAVELGACPDRSRAIINGCDTDVFHPADQRTARQRLGIPLDSTTLLFVGRIDVLKGVRELMRAFAEVAAKRPDVSLIMVGEGPARDEVTAIARAAQVGDRVRFVDPCPSTDVAQWMTAADMFVFPSYAEGCPNVVVEALHCGLPVVGTAVGGIPELVGPDNGTLVAPRDTEALRQALGAALTRHWDRNGIAKRAERSWMAVARELYDVCRQAADFHNSASKRPTAAAAVKGTAAF